MRVKESTKKVLFMICTKYPQCPMTATPAVVNSLTSLREDNQRLSERLDEARGAVVRMADKYAEARGDNPPERLGTPIRLGEYIDDVVRVAVERSKRKGKSK